MRHRVALGPRPSSLVGNEKQVKIWVEQSKNHQLFAHNAFSSELSHLKCSGRRPRQLAACCREPEILH